LKKLLYGERWHCVEAEVGIEAAMMTGRKDRRSRCALWRRDEKLNNIIAKAAGFITYGKSHAKAIKNATFLGASEPKY
jgi:hypothetical protein